MATQSADWIPKTERSWLERMWDRHAFVSTVGIVIILVCGGTEFLLTRSGHHLSWIWFGHPLWMLISMQLLSLKRILSPGPGLRAFMADHPGGFPVLMSVSRDSALMGQDEGVVRVDGGMLVYEGLHTSFRLAAEDVLVPEGRALDYQAMKGSELPTRAWSFYVVDEPECRVVLYPLNSGKFGPTDLTPFYDCLYGWLNDKPLADRESVLPPGGALPGWNGAEFYRGRSLLWRARGAR